MARGIIEKEPDPKIVYADIIDHPHWLSPTRPRMSLYDRAAQFAPFSALAGYHDMVSEEARIVGDRTDPGEEKLEELNRKLSLVDDMIRDGVMPVVSITRFIADPKKSGGSYETTVEQIRKIDAARGKVVLEKTAGRGNRHVEIDMKDILEFQREPVDSMEI